jgi:hypothetical protein
MPLDDETVTDLLFGDTDPRNLALFLAQQSLTMDPSERDQRITILNALNAHRTAELAVQTATVATHTSRVAFWTMVLAAGTVVLAAAAVIGLIIRP